MGLCLPTRQLWWMLHVLCHLSATRSSWDLKLVCSKDSGQWVTDLWYISPWGGQSRSQTGEAVLASDRIFLVPNTTSPPPPPTVDSESTWPLSMYFSHLWLRLWLLQLITFKMAPYVKAIVGTTTNQCPACLLGSSELSRKVLAFAEDNFC